MTDYIDYYTESEFDVLFSDIYENEGVSKIKELSRQLRTFFNYKAEVIQYKFRAYVPSDNSSNTNCTNNQFYTQKREIELLSQEFISLLSNIKRDDTTLEQKIYYLHFDRNLMHLKKLSSVTDKIWNIIHSISEQGIRDHPKFLKFIVLLARYGCFVKKCLNAEFYPFYEELEINYCNLEKKLNVLFGDGLSVKNSNTIKLREEGLLL